MPKANVNVKVDADVKELATQLLERMGLDQTTAIKIFFPANYLGTPSALPAFDKSCS